MATHSNVLAWRIPGAAEPGGLPSMGLHRVVGHNWRDLAAAAAAAAATEQQHNNSRRKTETFINVCELNSTLLNDHWVKEEIQQETEHTSRPGKMKTQLTKTLGDTVKTVLREMCVCVCVCVRAHVCMHSVAQSCPTLCNSLDCSLPCSSIHGIFQVRILKWVEKSSQQ